MRTRSTRRRFMASAGAALGGLCACAHPQRRAQEGYPVQQPNIIVLLTDDQRWDAMSCMGTAVIRTPNLDRLAQDGVLFENNFCTTSICMSSRATIFTGLYTRCHGINRFEDSLAEERFAYGYPHLLRQAGYRTGFIGKWGVGNAMPEDRLDYFKGFPGQGKYFHEVNGEQVHLTGIMGRQAEEFLGTCPADTPFCLSISFKAPHVQDDDPRQYLYDPADEALYQHDMVPLPKTAAPEYFDAWPDFIKTSEGRVRWEKRFATPEMYQNSVKGYYRLMNGVDAVVGRIRETIERQGMAGNTVIVFTSDNGIFNGEHGLAGKWLMHEESIRVPMIVCDPRLSGRQRRARRRAMTLTNDVMPTILDLAGVPVPANVQGRSLVPLMRDPDADWRSEWFYEHLFDHPRIPKSEGIRTAQWKYIRYIETDPLYEELYDIERDPFEERNLAPDSQYRDRLTALRARWEIWTRRLAEWQPASTAPWAEPAG